VVLGGRAALHLEDVVKFKGPVSGLVLLSMFVACSAAGQERVEASAPASLDARVGLGYMDGRGFDTLALTLGVSGFYFGVGFHRESAQRSEPDSLDVEGLELTGDRKFETFFLPFTFGAEVYTFERDYFSVRLDAEFKGGPELEFSKLITESGDRIPGTPDINLVLGVGTRFQVVHPISSWLGDNLRLIRNLYIGVGADLDLFSRQIEIESVSDGFFAASGYLIIGSTKTVPR
jgi:hypothetical protein